MISSGAMTLRIEDLFTRALEIPPGERGSWIRSQSDSMDVIRAVELLLELA